jgi:hypothetical protein
MKELRLIALWCERHELPPLTSIVEPEYEPRPSSPDQQRVYAFDWLSLLPPSVEELEKPYEWMAT